MHPGGASAQTNATEETRQHHEARHAGFEEVSIPRIPFSFVLSKEGTIYLILQFLKTY